MSDVINPIPGMPQGGSLESSEAKPANTADKQRSEFDVEINGTVGKPFVDNAKMSSRNCDVFYGDKQAIFGVDLDIGNNEILAMIGPSGCGKSTYLRVLNRMNDTIPICKVTGEHTLDGEDIYDKKTDPVYFHLGKLVEVNETDKVFTNPEHQLTENYITGRFG